MSEKKGSLREVIKSISDAGSPTIVVGKLLSKDPLKIVLVGDSKIVLTNVSVIIPSRRLKWVDVGEELYMLALNNNKTYYVLDRV